MGACLAPPASPLWFDKILLATASDFKQLHIALEIGAEGASGR